MCVLAAVQAQWDIMEKNLRIARQDSVQSFAQPQHGVVQLAVGRHFGCAAPERQTCTGLKKESRSSPLPSVSQCS